MPHQLQYLNDTRYAKGPAIIMRDKQLAAARRLHCRYAGNNFEHSRNTNVQVSTTERSVTVLLQFTTECQVSCTFGTMLCGPTAVITTQQCCSVTLIPDNSLLNGRDQQQI
jgi:hypothetical protein